jgi:hypothetical protein
LQVDAVTGAVVGEVPVGFGDRVGQVGRDDARGQRAVGALGGVADEVGGDGAASSLQGVVADRLPEFGDELCEPVLSVGGASPVAVVDRGQQ